MENLKTLLQEEEKINSLLKLIIYFEEIFP